MERRSLVWYRWAEREHGRERKGERSESCCCRNSQLSLQGVACMYNVLSLLKQAASPELNRGRERERE